MASLFFLHAPIFPPRGEPTPDKDADGGEQREEEGYAETALLQPESGKIA